MIKYFILKESKYKFIDVYAYVCVYMSVCAKLFFMCKTLLLFQSSVPGLYFS